MMALPMGTDASVDSEELMNWLVLNDILDEENFLGQNQELLGLNQFDIPSVESKPLDIRIKLESEGNQQQAQGNKASSAQSKDTIKLEKGSRKRQRESLEDMETRVAAMMEENEELQNHVMTVMQRTAEVQKRRSAMETFMTSELAQFGHKENFDQSELAKVIKQYTNIYSDYGKCRQREVSFHLNQLEKLILPTQTTKMCLWTLQQDKNFYQKSKSPMYNILSKELTLSVEQAAKIQDRRDKRTDLLSQLNESLTLIRNLKTTIERKHACYDGICGRIQEAALPKQMVLFLFWLEKNGDIMAKYMPNYQKRNLQKLLVGQLSESTESEASSTSSSHPESSSTSNP